jgi:Matrixin
MKTTHTRAANRCLLKLAVVLFALNIAWSGSQTYAYELSPWKWPQTQLGAPVTLTYSYSNFLDGGLLDSSEHPVPVDLLRSSIEEALSVWAAVVPLHFIEVPDMGPIPTAADLSYFGTGFPQIRIGHHPIDGFGNVKAHGYYPPQSGSDDQIPGDVHFDDQDRWEMIGSLTYPDILGAAVHELGHSLGLFHSTDEQAVMFPTFPRRQGLGTAFLTADDVAGIQAIYGSGVGSVTPIPEPRAAILLLVGIFGILSSFRQR